MAVKRLHEEVSQEALNRIALLLAQEPEQPPRKPPVEHPVGSPFRELKPMGYPTSHMTRWGRRR